MMNHRPAIIFSALDDVDLVAAARPVETRWPVLCLKHQIRPGLPVNPLRVAMPVRVDFRTRTLLPDEWIVRRHSAVVVEAQNFSAERIKLLCDCSVGRVSGRDVELAVGAEAQARSRVKLRRRNPF